MNHVKAVNAVQLAMGRWILVLPAATNWAWAGTRFVEHFHGVSRESHLMTWASEAEAQDYAKENLLPKAEEEKDAGKTKKRAH